MPKKRTTVNGNHGERLKKIRRFVDFDYDLRKPLTTPQKRKVKKYYDEIAALSNRPYQVYRPREAKNLAPAQKFAQHRHKLPGLRVAFIPTDGKNKVRLTFGKKGAVGHTKHVTTRKIWFNARALIKDPIAHVEQKISGNAAQQFTIMAAEFEIPSPYIAESIAAAVAKKVMKYSETGGLSPDDNHYYTNWLWGLNAYTFDEQAGLQEYLIEKQKAIKAGKRKRDAARKARRRARERS